MKKNNTSKLNEELNKFEKGLLHYFSLDYLNYIKNFKVGIAGLGGLGSNILNALVRVGFSDFIICDLDKVDLSNLNRQNYDINDIHEYKTTASKNRNLKINNKLKIETFEKKLDKSNIKEVFNSCYCIFEAFDNVESKKAIYESLFKEDKFLVFGSGMAGFNITKTPIEIKKIKENIFIVGDNISAVDKNNPPLAPKVITVASLMAGVFLEHIYIKFSNNL